MAAQLTPRDKFSELSHTTDFLEKMGYPTSHLELSDVLAIQGDILESISAWNNLSRDNPVTDAFS